jgi:hypothetical protein
MVRDQVSFVILSALVGMALFVTSSRPAPAPPVSHEQAHAGVIKAEAYPGPIRLLAPVAAATAEAKPLEGDEAEILLAPPKESRSLTLFLGEFDAWNRALEAGTVKPGMPELLGRLATHAEDIRKAGATPEEIDARLESFLKAARGMGLSASDLAWLETEAGLQRSLAAARH